MIAAIYARKSTEQQTSEEQKSVARQIALGREYATKKGWTVAEECIWTDDAISGAEFVKRPGYNALTRAVESNPPFQVLILYELSRLGRDQIETVYTVKRIVDAGVMIAQIAEDRLVTPETLDDEVEILMLQVRAFAATSERKKASTRTYDAMRRKAEALHVTGGKVYGYTNVEVLSEPDADGRRKRLYVKREINPEQAEVVRRMFQMAANGLGLKKIARTLNRERVSPPRPHPNGWAPTAIREILKRELYRGVIVWGKSKKVVRRGTRAQEQRNAEEWLRKPAPDLRIVSNEWWTAARERIEQTCQLLTRNGKGHILLGRPAGPDADSPYLLAGFLTCGVCGAHVRGHRQLHGTGPASNRKRVTFYGCAYHRDRGPEVCSNAVVLRGEIIERAIIDAVSKVLDQRIVDAAIETALDRLREGQEKHVDRRTQIEREQRQIEQRLGRLVQALVAGGALETIVQHIKAEEERKKALQAELEALEARRMISLDAERLKHQIRAKTEDVRSLLGKHTTGTRQLLRKLVANRIVAEPFVENGRKGYHLEGKLNVGKLLAGDVYENIVSTANGWWPQRDSNPCFRIESPMS